MRQLHSFLLTHGHTLQEVKYRDTYIYKCSKWDHGFIGMLSVLTDYAVDGKFEVRIVAESIQATFRLRINTAEKFSQKFTY